MTIPSIPATPGEATATPTQTSATEDIKQLAESIYGKTPQGETPKNVSTEDSTENKLPTLASYLETIRGVQEGQPTEGAFSENFESVLNNAVDPQAVLSSRLSSLKDKSPQERANIGTKFGGGLGLAMNGATGAVVGAGIGAFVSRALGTIQSGEHELGVRRSKMVDTFKTTKIADDDGNITFEDGGKFKLDLDPQTRLRNLDSTVSGKKDRTVYEIDGSHPLSKRTTAVAKPFAYLFAQGMMNWRDPKNTKDSRSLDHTTGMLVNAFQADATSINQVYTRAKEMAGKLKMNEQEIRRYFDSIKYKLGEKEFEAIKYGLDQIYG